MTAEEQQAADEQLKADAALARGDDGLNAFGDEGGQGGEQQSQAQSAEGQQADEGQQKTNEGQQATAAQPAAQQPTAGLNEEQMVRILKAAGIGQQQQAAAPVQQQQAPQMTQEEFDQKFNVFKPTTEMIEAIRAGGEGAMAALAQVAQGINKQALTLAGYQLQLEVQKLKEELGGQIAPVRSFVEERQREQLKQDFVKSYPELADYEVIGNKVVAEFQASGRKFSSKEDAFKATAEGIHAVLKSIGVTPQAKAGNGTAANGAVQQQPTSRMSTLSGGGQGAGKPPAAPQNKNVTSGLEVF